MSLGLALAFAYTLGGAADTSPPAPVPAPERSTEATAPAVQALVPVELDRPVTVVVAPGTSAPPNGPPPPTSPAPSPPPEPATAQPDVTPRPADTASPGGFSAPIDATPAPTDDGPSTAPDGPPSLPMRPTTPGPGTTTSTRHPGTSDLDPEVSGPSPTATPGQVVSPSDDAKNPGTDGPTSTFGPPVTTTSSPPPPDDAPPATPAEPSPTTTESATEPNTETATALPTTTGTRTARPSTSAPSTPASPPPMAAPPATWIGPTAPAPTATAPRPPGSPTSGTPRVEASTLPAAPLPTSVEAPATRPLLIGPRVDRHPPADRAESAPLAFPPRSRRSNPGWASGATTTARDLPRTLRTRPGTDVLEIRLAGASWSELGPSNAAFGLARRHSGPVVWTVPLDVAGTPLSEVAQGRHDKAWAALAAGVSGRTEQVVVRLEMPAHADATQAVAAFRAASQVLHDSGVLVEWGVARGAPPENIGESWPGADAVDIVGVVDEAGPSWTQDVAGAGGLADWSSWARAHDKRLAVHWSIDGRTSVDRVAAMADWLDLTASEGSLAYDSAVVDGRADPRTLASYRRLWDD